MSLDRAASEKWIRARRPPPRERLRFLDEVNGLPPDDPWFARLRLEPWGDGLADTFDLAIRVGAFAHAIAWLRQREALPGEERPGFDRWFRVILRRAIARTLR